LNFGNTMLLARLAESQLKRPDRTEYVAGGRRSVSAQEVE
jgi:hypothetical protein